MDTEPKKRRPPRRKQFPRRPKVLPGATPIVAAELAAGSPVLGSPTLTQNHALAAADLATASAAIGAPAASPEVTPPFVEPPPTGWMKSGYGDGDKIRAQAASRARMLEAAQTQSTFVPPPQPPPPMGWMGQPLGMPKTLTHLSDVPPGNTVIVPPQNAAEMTTPQPVIHSGAAFLRGQGIVAANAQIIERNLLDRPADIRDAARVLAKEIKDQVEELRKSKPNDAEGLAKHNDFVAFLEKIAAGLAELADALDQAINANAQGSPEPMFLGKAARIAEQLNIGLTEWLEANRANLVGCTLRIGVIGAGYLFLHACGLDGRIAAIVSGLVNRGFSNKTAKAAPTKKRSPRRRKA